MNIGEILKQNQSANVSFTISATDLKEFALALIDEAKKMQTETSPVRDEELTVSQVAKQLGVSVTTLWRWEQRGYLKPHGHIGKRPIYLQSQLDELKSTDL